MAKEEEMKDSASYARNFDNSKSGGKMPKDKKKSAPTPKKPTAAKTEKPKTQKPVPVKPAVKKVTSVGVTGSKGGRSVSVKVPSKSELMQQWDKQGSGYFLSNRKLGRK